MTLLTKGEQLLITCLNLRPAKFKADKGVAEAVIEKAVDQHSG